MMNTTGKLIFISFIFCASSVSNPMVGQAQQKVLTLEKALSMVRPKSSLTTQREYAREAIQQEVKLYQADYWPALQFRANVSHANQAPRIPVEFENDTVLARQGTRDTFISRFELTQMIYDFGKTKHAVEAAQWKARAIDADFDRQIADLHNQIRDQFYRSVYYQELDSVYAIFIPFAKDLKQINDVKLANGVTLSPEVLKAQVELQDLSAKQVAAQSEYRKTLVQIAYLTGQPTIDFDTEGDLPMISVIQKVLASYPDLYELALAHRSDIDQLSYQSEQQIALSKSINALKYPTFMLQSDFSYFGPDAFGYYSNLSSRGLDPVNWRVGIGFTYTLFDGFRIRSQKNQALALHKQYREQAIRLEDQVAAQIKMLLGDLENLRGLAESNQLLIEQINTNIATTKTALKNGNIPRIEYVKAVIPLASAKASMLKIRSDIAQVLVHLEATAGTDISAIWK